jgi:subtilisin family serine protease
MATLLAIALTATVAAAPSGAEAQTLADKVDASVLTQTSGGKLTTFWVQVSGEASLAAASKTPGGRAARATAVYRTKRTHAERSQAGLRTYLRARGAIFTPYWVANTIQVTGDAALISSLAARPDVSHVYADVTVHPTLERAIPTRTPVAVPAAGGVEWNLDQINARRVWEELGVRGEGIVIASIDSGVRYDHPALAASYRGQQADGTFDHNYNWFDTLGMCSQPGPCDPVGHGTHTMGTMVGQTPDGANRIGVAPGAKWITARGNVVAAGQWLLAPTDRGGNNPRPDLAPDIINNSWGGGRSSPWYRPIIESWIAAGVFPVFSIGNTGPTCGSAESPADNDVAYGVGAVDSENAVAGFSARGAATVAGKPDISAPGVDVRSSNSDGGYLVASGTSMAAPHVSGTVALLWSAVPSLAGDVAATRGILDQTAHDGSSASCGGTLANNNGYGEGTLDAYAAVRLALTNASQ